MHRRSAVNGGRDYSKLRVFVLADALTVEIYKITGSFPSHEKFGLRSQLLRAAVSVPSNIVEGSARRTTRDYLHFLNVALGSATEARYLIGLATRIGYLDSTVGAQVESRYDELVRSLQKLIGALDQRCREPDPP